MSKVTVKFNENGQTYHNMFGISDKRNTQLMMLFEEKMTSLAFETKPQEMIRLFFGMAENDQEVMYMMFKAGQFDQLKRK